MSIEYRVGDVYDRLQEIPDGSIDLIVTSPPFLALRSYLPADGRTTPQAKDYGA
jgi:DNA modification methylase